MINRYIVHSLHGLFANGAANTVAFDQGCIDTTIENSRRPGDSQDRVVFTF